MNLFARDYLKGMDEVEKKEYEEIKENEKIFKNSNERIQPRKNLYHKYPKAARHCNSLFPNNYLDIMDLCNSQLADENLLLKALIENPTTTEREILNFINDNQNYHIIG